MSDEIKLEIQDGGEQTIKCSDCNKPLIHYRPYAKLEGMLNTIKALCPFCKGQSFEKTVQGMFWYGPISTEESATPTIVEDIEQLENNKWIFHLKAR